MKDTIDKSNQLSYCTHLIYITVVWEFWTFDKENQLASSTFTTFSPQQPWPPNQPPDLRTNCFLFAKPDKHSRQAESTSLLFITTSKNVISTDFSKNVHYLRRSCYTWSAWPARGLCWQKRTFPLVDTARTFEFDDCYLVLIFSAFGFRTKFSHILSFEYYYNDLISWHKRPHRSGNLRYLS